ncbi:MAG: sodium:calcium antiporter [Candidatus Nealsonbacteria bacterium]|nr:sodium:calcium antiporter [Candidatus Nealsonbacteria bacterium]
MILLNIIIFIASCLVLVRAGTWVIQALSRIALYLRWSEFVVAFILMAFVSSLPELFIGISSALHGAPQISLGNIIGANVINLTLAVGLSVIFLGGLPVERKIVRRDSLYTAFVALLPLILILDGRLSRIDGIILLLFFTVYLSWLFVQKDRFSRTFNSKTVGFNRFLKDIFVFLISVGLLLVSAELVINSAISFAEVLQVPPIFIGILIIGAGTALPETYFAVRAALKHKPEMILGNLMGAVIITSLFVLGIVALISPIEITNFSPYFIARIFLFLAAIFFFVFIHTGEKISRKEAVFLLFIYIVFVAVEILVQ